MMLTSMSTARNGSFLSRGDELGAGLDAVSIGSTWASEIDGQTYIDSYAVLPENGETDFWGEQAPASNYSERVRLTQSTAGAKRTTVPTMRLYCTSATRSKKPMIFNAAPG